MALTLNDARSQLKRQNRRKGANEFRSTLESFPKRFETRDGTVGTQLLQLDNEDHQKGLVRMAHAYLCISGHGRAHWPEGSNDNTLEYPRDENKIYYYVLCHFIRKNITDSGSKLRSKRPRDEERAFMPRPPRRRRRLISVIESPIPSPTPPLTRSPMPLIYDSDESEAPHPSSQDSLSTGISGQEEPRQEAYQIVPRADESPDELAQDHDEEQPMVQLNLQQRHVNRIGDEHGNLSRISLGQQPTPRGPRTNLHERNISTGTQTTFGADQQRRQRDADAPPPSSLDTNNSSQQTHIPIIDKENEAEEPASQSSVEDIPRPFATPLAHPRMAIPEPEFKIDLVVSYDVIPGLNRPFEPRGDIFTYSLKGLLDQFNWQSEPEVLFICLQAPGTSPATPVRTWMDGVFKNNEDKFQLVLRRFKQIFLGLQYEFTRVKMDAVIEIAFENMVEGHTHSPLVDAWRNRGRAAGGKV
ncbi:hypothetical protein FSPOR_4280 [Fusarium sporotrichioides]|uniref:Uncharacterized protein n=1 Tax=Fusarium sporotrichioides TaxID=5514 RepID=A0A395SCA7_FUSSP|nr:hypothetical protein FSPOR_4280 [Fusarium sporotrichioides]